jgi:hypothetical protein
MADFYQGQRAQNANGDMLVYDVKKGWMASDQASNSAYKNAMSDVATQKAAVQRMNPQAQLLPQAADLNSQLQGGGLNAIHQFAEWSAANNDKVGLFDNIGKRIQTSSNPAQGQGAISDYERRLFAAGAPSIGQRQEVNRDIIAQRQAITNEQRDYANFLDDYVRQHGNEQGAQELWQSYTARDPYYGPSPKTGKNVAFTKDPNRWRQFIYQNYQIKPQSTVAPPRKAGAANAGGWSVTKVQ